MIARTRRISLFAFAVSLAALAALAMMIGAQDAQSASYKTCSLSESDRDPAGSKPTYNLTLSHKDSSCATAKKVMKGFHACRTSSGYRCTSKVKSNWTCTGKKTSSTTKLFYGSFTCTYGDRRVKSSYQQNT